MSCYTSARITENPEFAGLQQRCTQYVENQRSGLNDAFTECQELEGRLNTMGQGLSQQIEQVTSVLRSVEENVSGANTYLTEVGEQMAVLRRTCARVQESSHTLLQISRQSLEVGINQAKGMTETLSLMNEATLRVRDELADTPESLKQCFKTVEDRLAELMKLYGESEEQTQELEQVWQQVVRMEDALAKTRDEWCEVYAELANTQQSISSRISGMTLVADSLDMSRAAAFALLDALQDKKFDLIAYERTSEGIEAFLEDNNSRKVAFRFTTEPDVSQRILLELNVSDFESEDESVSCQEITEEMLDVLSETGVLEDTRTNLPHRADFGVLRTKGRQARDKRLVIKKKDVRLKDSRRGN